MSEKLEACGVNERGGGGGEGWKILCVPFQMLKVTLWIPKFLKVHKFFAELQEHHLFVSESKVWSAQCIDYLSIYQNALKGETKYDIYQTVCVACNFCVWVLDC